LSAEKAATIAVMPNEARLCVSVICNTICTATNHR
jgi:hypothetical protein